MSTLPAVRELWLSEGRTLFYPKMANEAIQSPSRCPCGPVLLERHLCTKPLARITKLPPYSWPGLADPNLLESRAEIFHRTIRLTSLILAQL